MLRKQSNISYQDYIIFICLCFYLIIDSITGFLLKSSGSGISIPYKLFLFFLMISSISSKSLNVISFISFLFFLMMICLFIYLFRQNNEEIFISLSAILKLILNIIYFIYFYLFFKNHGSTVNNIIGKFLIINILVFLFNIILGLLGFGYYSYDIKMMGVKGFFYAGNEVAVLYVCLYFIFLSKLTYKYYKYNKVLIVYLLSFIVSILLATKVSVFSCIFISGIDYYIRSSKKRRFYIKLFFPIIIFILITLGTYFIPQTQFYKMIEYNVNRNMLRGQHFIEAIFSGRILLLRNSLKIWKHHRSPGVLFWGLGPMLHKGVEMDAFDTFFMLGIIFLSIVLLFYVYLIYLSYKIKNYRLFLFNLIYLTISVIAGHVWYGVMAGLFFAYINAYELVYCNKLIYKNQEKRIS